MIKNNITWSFQESGAVPTDRRTAERRIMQVSSSVSNRYYTPYQTSKSEKYGAYFTKTEDEDMTFDEETENQGLEPNLPEELVEMSFWDLISSGKGNDFIMKSSEEVQEQAERYLKEEQVVFAGAIGSANQYFKYADEAGIINYNGIIFYCDAETDTLMLGDCSNVSKCIRISLTDGGFLMVNRDNLDQLFDALPFFSPEDMIKILQVLQQEKMADDSIVGMEQEEDKILEMAEGEKQIKRSLEEVPDYSEYLKKKIDEIFVKIQNGDTEPSYQIGSQSFTQKEWEKFLERFDSIEEAIRELMKEEQERKEAEKKKQKSEINSSFWEERIRTIKKENISKIDDGVLLTAETTFCKYETANPEDDDIIYVTFYTTDGIRCKKLGAEDFEWTLTFENEEQYNKVIEFLGNFSSDWNMRFVAHENFWNDFLNDEIDMEAFMEFINGTNKGVPDYSVTVGDSMYIHTDKMQWAKYTNPLGAGFYTAEEMHQMQMEIIAANEAKLTKFTDWDAYEEMYKENHPEYNGEKICCEYPGGPLYTVKEMAGLKYRKMLEQMGITEEEMQQRREEWRKQMGYPGY